MEKIEELFEKIIGWGYNTRSKKLDGLKRWNIMKDILSQSKVKGSWNQKVKEYFVEMRSTLKIQECKDEFKGTPEDIQREWEKHHFYLQHARIPTLNFSEPTLVRLMQIAYNAGQLRAEWNNDFYNKDMRDFYGTNRLDNIHTYMNDESLVILNNSIDDQIMDDVNRRLSEENDVMSGGGDSVFVYKYLKYKQKYLSEKLKYMKFSYNKYNDMQGL